jgi:NitT/TauT family transport system substrate-binding protein
MLSTGGWRRLVASCLIIVCALHGGCDRGKPTNGGSANSPKIQLTLDWKPEPEFGGFYAARESGAFTRRGLDVEIKTAGPGAPTWQLVATGKTDFAVTAADQVMIARTTGGADVVAVFAVYQTSPQAVMAHRSRGFTKLQDVWTNPGVLAAEDNAWLRFLRKQFGEPKVTITGFGGGVSPAFLERTDFSQQCFVFSEPVLARQKGADPQTFLVADAGYNPYTTVVITTGRMVREQPQKVRAMVEACRDGWRAYLDNPGPTNDLIVKLNSDMSPATIGQMADAQKPLIEAEETKRLGLGTMTPERWQTLGQQLVELGVIQTAPPAEQCFVSADKLPAPAPATTRP